MSRVRIVGGQWRSRLLDVAHVPGLRPTPDRVRETLFNWLGQGLTGMTCLDLFGGTGILGFEAASRGAERVVIVESDARAHAALRQSVTALDAMQVEVIRADALRFVQTATEKFDVVFLDPPYHKGWLERLEPWLDRLLKPDGWLYAEAETAIGELAGLSTIKAGRAGLVHFHLLQGSQE
ncbi:MAG TPA: 16S rRNA (guanine(966)-N(2))-methyltransferase RsmD [Aromatoleum sp.]|uniref:16S rRNA (guanine(966)-N(2))-methyltransferase RsmD n=1 Tax=Aromatoleum sp. TaxID=2307007 RepID=UPI002B45CE3D|nr:16S rRNA (guanine(966)-N(2))-methyltransferase RsmD [Aromatoleum sp.]HJV25301.1 16S rRNA (guanine(966)-N(2))-methyltransferase RsmD [Aromatoleum sp.]